MARPPRFHEGNRPYFVTTATHDRKPIFGHAGNALPMIEVLYRTRAEYGFQLLGWVIMPDHLHAVIMPADRNTISQVMRYIRGRFSRLHNISRNSSGPVWQSSFYDRAVRDERALREILTYIFDNPVRKGLVEVANQYPFSSAKRAVQH